MLLIVVIGNVQSVNHKYVFNVLGYGAAAKQATGLSDWKERGKRLTVRELRNSRRRSRNAQLPLNLSNNKPFEIPSCIL